VSVSTTQRDIKACGFVDRARKPKAYNDPKTKAKRLLFTRKLKRLTVNEKNEFIQKCIFADEKQCNTDACYHTHQYVRMGEEPDPQEREGQGAAQLRIFGAIGIGFKALAILPATDPNWKRLKRLGKDSNLTQEEKAKRRQDNRKKPLTWTAATFAAFGFPALLEGDPKKRPGKSMEGRILVMDGAKAHYGKAATAWLENKKVAFKPQGWWPAHSPDLNPIENLWSIIEAEVASTVPWSREDLEEEWVKAWEAYPQEAIDELVRSFYRRVDEVEKRDGGWA
jgi:hypothetical protein